MLVHILVYALYAPSTPHQKVSSNFLSGRSKRRVNTIILVTLFYSPFFTVVFSYVYGVFGSKKVDTTFRVNKKIYPLRTVGKRL